MMFASTACPHPLELRQYALGQLETARAEAVTIHVKSCATCQQALRPLQERPSESSEAESSDPTIAFAPTKDPGDFVVQQDSALSFLGPAEGPDELGRLSHYRLIRLLGEGGMGMVFLAEDMNLERPVALKVMKPSLAAHPIHQQRFLREAKATAALHDDYIVTIYHVGEERGVPFLAMELLEGLPMDKWLARGRKPTVAQILRLGRQTALGLAAAHEKGMVHRDIKPANLWIDSSAGGRIKILDFGLARPSGDPQLTQTGMILGTPAFMSPEQARGHKLDFRSDLFSLGCVLYRLVAGKIPFGGESTMAVLTALAVDVPRPVRELNADVPRPLEELIDQLLQKNPDDRPASARAVANQLLAIEKELSGSATHVLLPAAAPAPSRTPAFPGALIAAAPEQPVVPIAKTVRPRWGAWQLWLVAAVAGVLLAVVIYLVRRPEGMLVVNVQDPSLELTIRSGEKVLALHSRGRQFHLTEGAGSVEVFDSKQRLTRVAFHIGRSETLVLQLDDEVAQARRQMVPHRSLRVFTPLDPVWLKEVKGLAEPLRLPLVEAELLRRNPQFRGALLFQRLAEDSIGLEIKDSRRLEDLSPLVMLPQLRRLAIHGAHGREPLDLTSLRELRLVELCLWKTPVASLESLQGMPLEKLEVNGSKQLLLAPLRNVKSLKMLNLLGSTIVSLEPLRGLALEALYVDDPRIVDLAPLDGMPLKCLDVLGTSATSLEPLGKSPLRTLYLPSQVQDLTPLTGLPLEQLNVSDEVARNNMHVLRSLKRLQAINGQPTDEFLGGPQTIPH